MDYSLAALIITLVIQLVVVVHWAGKLSQKVENVSGDVDDIKDIVSKKYDDHEERIRKVELAQASQNVVNFSEGGA